MATRTQTMYSDLKPYDAPELSCFPWCFHREGTVFRCKRWKVKRQLLPTLLFYNRRRRRERPLFFGLAKTATQSLATGVDSLPRHCTLPITRERGSRRGKVIRSQAINLSSFTKCRRHAAAPSEKDLARGERQAGKPCSKY